eukprot:scaffold17559_cov110-Isochrysis_galbana.AAC.12
MAPRPQDARPSRQGPRPQGQDHAALALAARARSPSFLLLLPHILHTNDSIIQSYLCIHDHLVEYDLAQYTIHRPRQHPTTQTERIRQRHTEWVPETRQNQDNYRRKRPVGSQWEP